MVGGRQGEGRMVEMGGREMAGWLGEAGKWKDGRRGKDG